MLKMKLLTPNFVFQQDNLTDCFVKNYQHITQYKSFPLFDFIVDFSLLNPMFFHSHIIKCCKNNYISPSISPKFAIRSLYTLIPARNSSACTNSLWL